jgi:hypothetical protein
MTALNSPLLTSGLMSAVNATITGKNSILKVYSTCSLNGTFYPNLTMSVSDDLLKYSLIFWLASTPPMIGIFMSRIIRS